MTITQKSNAISRIVLPSGITVLISTAGTALLQDAQGPVTGIAVENRSGSFEITAKRIIIATGGASWSQDLRDSQAELGE